MITEANFGDRLTLTQFCPFCKATNLVDGEALQLGVVVDATIGPDIILLPSCGACGGTEHLNRYVDEIPLAAVTDHRILVNAVADYLKAQGHTAPECQLVYAHEAPTCTVTGPFTKGTVLTAKPNLPVS